MGGRAKEMRRRTMRKNVLSNDLYFRDAVTWVDALGVRDVRLVRHILVGVMHLYDTIRSLRWECDIREEVVVGGYISIAAWRAAQARRVVKREEACEVWEESGRISGSDVAYDFAGIRWMQDGRFMMFERCVLSVRQFAIALNIGRITRGEREIKEKKDQF
ncbi:hypothetical protein PV325_005229 [Microctonus aethiopoides]|nr:hypothetical protein PV325_005229 [Microctonus aethiopoides]